VWENPTAGAEAGAIFFQTRANSADTTASTERMRITASGNVGIGTANPDAKLSITATGPGTRVLQLGTERPWVFRQFGTGAGTALELTGADPSNNNKQFVINTDGTVVIGTGTTTPQGKLQVIGDVKLGSSGQLYAPGGEENLRIIRGKVAADGSLIFGSGFTVNHIHEGHYTIQFTPPFVFPQSAVVTATPNNLNASDPVKVIELYNDFQLVEVLVYKRSDGTFVDGSFHFIAIGPR
jgi:hypothetical protein